MANIKVAVRVRPICEKETLVGGQRVVCVRGQTTLLTNTKASTVSHASAEGSGSDHRGKVHTFTFDYAHDDSSPPDDDEDGGGQAEGDDTTEAPPEDADCGTMTEDKGGGPGGGKPLGGGTTGDPPPTASSEGRLRSTKGSADLQKM
ncbi:unnamed protein product, partial [Meganyctiphanes norvegica]